MDSKDSSQSSSSNSPANLTDAHQKSLHNKSLQQQRDTKCSNKRCHDRDEGTHRPWLTKAAKKYLSQRRQETCSDKEEIQEEEPDAEEEEDEPFSDTEDNENLEDPEDRIARFFDTEDYQQLLAKCLSALDLKDKPPEEGTIPTSATPPGIKGKYIHPMDTLWGSMDYFPKCTSQ